MIEVVGEFRNTALTVIRTIFPVAADEIVFVANLLDVESAILTASSALHNKIRGFFEGVEHYFSFVFDGLDGLNLFEDVHDFLVESGP